MSVLLIVAVHTGDGLWGPLHGYLGVTVFFVISGLLITTLLLREEDRHGRVSIRRFYVRRSFRIFPLYYLALGVLVVAELGLGMGSDPDALRHRLPLFAAYFGEFAGGGSFWHSWSLGIEEKFHFVWPLLGFGVLCLRRHRFAIVDLLLAASVLSAPFDRLNYFAIYLPILAGCLLALVLHSRSTFGIAERLARHVVAAPLGLLALVELLLNRETSYVHVRFSVLVALLMPAALIGSVRVPAVLSSRALRYVGTRAYGLYLFHPIVRSLMDRILPPGQPGVPLQVLRFVVLVAGTLLVADLLYRLLEKPLIGVGRRLTASSRPLREVPADLGVPSPRTSPAAPRATGVRSA